MGTMWWYTISNKNGSVVIHNTIDFGKKLFFQIFFIYFGIDFQTFIVHKKLLRSSFSRYSSRNHYLFRLSIGVMEKLIILNIILIFKSIHTRLFWEFKRTSKIKFFSSCHTHLSTERLFLNLSINAPALFVHISCVPELITLSSNPVSTAYTGGIFQPLLATCSYYLLQDYLLVNRLNFQ